MFIWAPCHVSVSPTIAWSQPTYNSASAGWPIKSEPQSRESAKLFSVVGIGTPPPPPPQASVHPHPLVRGVGHTRLRERGWRSPNSDEGTYTVVPYIYKYFVVRTNRWEKVYCEKLCYGLPRLLYPLEVSKRNNILRSHQKNLPSTEFNITLFYHFLFSSWHLYTVALYLYLAIYLSFYLLSPQIRWQSLRGLCCSPLFHLQF